MSQTLALSTTPTKDNSPVSEVAYSVESGGDGVYSVSMLARYSAEGEPLNTTQKELISQLSHAIESKSVFISERGLTFSQWTEYSEHTKRVQYSTASTSSITAETVTVDGSVLSQKDTAGVVTTFTRSYTVNDSVVDFQPEYDADGNQTRVKTSTGIWAVSYDTENRPTDFTSMAADNTITTVHCEYDSLGRRAIKRVMVNGNVTLHQRYIYRGYLQIACIDLTRSHHPALWYITWDPTQNIATRPLAIQKDGTWYTYGWDLTKNICEVYRNNGTLGTSYTYTPYGLPSQSTNGAAAGSVEQPIQWSSEFNDTELGLIYYNYRHYNPADGRWMGRDRIHERGGVNMYAYTANRLYIHDYLGNALPALLLIVLSRAAIGAGAGVISRIAGDVIEWKLSSFSKYVAAAVGGAIGNTLKNYTWSFAASSFVEAALNNLMGDDKSTPCQFMADVALNAVIMKSGMKYIEMPHLSSSIKDILGRMNMNFNLILVNIYKSGGNGLQNKIYKFAKKIYYELPGSAPATILRSSVTRGMEMKPVQLELDEINDSFHQYQQYQEYYQEENRYFWEHYGFPHMLNIKQ